MPAPFQVNQNNASGEIFYDGRAAVGSCTHKVLLRLTGRGIGKVRPAPDVVTVLDVSGSMRGDKIETLKKAMKFVIQKIGNNARLSIVTFSTNASLLRDLEEVNDASRPQVEKTINNLKAGGYTNMEAGLNMALDVLRRRTDADGREAAIMFMSDGEENGGDATLVDLSDVFVQTFGFGQGSDYKPEFLRDIAGRSKGGVFSPVSLDTISLTGAFGQCLAGLLTVAVQDLKVKVTASSSCKIEKVHAGSYHTLAPDSPDNATVSFGSVFKDEFRHLLLHIGLPPSEKGVRKSYLEITYEFKAGEEIRKGNRFAVSITRVENPAALKEPEEIIVEQARVDTVEKMKQAGKLAAAGNLVDARKALDEGIDLLSLLGVVGASQKEAVELLKKEVEQIKGFMADADLYSNFGSPVLQACVLCHERQRFAAKGEDAPRLFATPYMGVVLKQVEEYVKDPQKPVPKVDEDIQKEVEEELKNGGSASGRDPPIKELLNAMVTKFVDAVKNLAAKANEAYKLLLRLFGVRVGVQP